MMTVFSDRRQHPRLPMEVEVELYRPGQPMTVVRTEDLSTGGVLLILGGHSRPPVGSLVQVRVCGLLGGGDAPPLVSATVVRHSDEGVAVQFRDDLES